MPKYARKKRSQSRAKKVSRRKAPNLAKRHRTKKYTESHNAEVVLAWPIEWRNLTPLNYESNYDGEGRAQIRWFSRSNTYTMDNSAVWTISQSPEFQRFASIYKSVKFNSMRIEYRPVKYTQMSSGTVSHRELCVGSYEKNVFDVPFAASNLNDWYKKENLRTTPDYKETNSAKPFTKTVNLLKFLKKRGLPTVFNTFESGDTPTPIATCMKALVQGFSNENDIAMLTVTWYVTFMEPKTLAE